MAFVVIGEKDAEKLLGKGYLKVGLVNGEIRKRVTVVRCFRCLGYWHKARFCEGPDRRDMCLKCGQTDHKSRECVAPMCFLCPQQQHGTKNGPNHAPESGQCRAYMEAL